MIFDLTLYLVTDRLQLTEADFFKQVKAACEGGVTLVQLREKDVSSRMFFELALKIKAITDAYHIPLIINDRLDIALAVDSAGVHLGQSDLPICEARHLLGPDKIIGATAKTVSQALRAVEEGADYLGVGAIYPTTTKVKTVLTDISTLNDICKAVTCPVVAIGGLNEANCDILAESPIAGIAVVSTLMKAVDAKLSAQCLKEKVISMRQIKM